MPKYQNYFVVKKKVVFDDKNSNLFCDDKKKMVFNDKKIRSVFYMFFKKNEKDFLRREFHS